MIPSSKISYNLYAVQFTPYAIIAQGAELEFFFDGFPKRLRIGYDRVATRQTDFAELVRRVSGVKMTQPRVSELLSGSGKPSLQEVEMLAAAIGVTPEWLAFNRGRGVQVEKERATTKPRRVLKKVQGDVPDVKRG